MNPKPLRPPPEKTMAGKIDRMLEAKGWFVKTVVGNAYQSGLPDRFITHRNHGGRWVEYKWPHKYHFTPAQLETFPKMLDNGTGVWVLSGDTEDEYKKLMEPPNFHQYLGHTKKYI